MTKINCGHWLFGFRMVCVCMRMWIFWWKKGQSSANIYIYDIYNTHVDYLFWLNCFRNEILYFKYFSFWICIKEIITGSVVVNCNMDTQISHCFIIYNKRIKRNIWKNNIFTIDLKCHKRKIPSIRLISHSNEGISREIVEVYLCLQL